MTMDQIIDHALPLAGLVSLNQLTKFEALNRLCQCENKKPVELVVLPPDEWRSKIELWRVGRFDPIFEDQDQVLMWCREKDGIPETVRPSERITGLPSQTLEEWLGLLGCPLKID